MRSNQQTLAPSLIETRLTTLELIMQKLALRFGFLALLSLGCESNPDLVEEYRSPIMVRVRVDSPRSHEFLCGGTLDVSTGGEFTHRNPDGTTYENDIHGAHDMPGSCGISRRVGQQSCILAPAYNNTLNLHLRYRAGRPLTEDDCRDLARLVEVWPYEVTSTRYLTIYMSVEADGNGCQYQLDEP